MTDIPAAGVVVESSSHRPSALRVMVIVEERWIAGAARAMLELARVAQNPLPGLPRLHLSVVTFAREAVQGGNPVVDAFLQTGVPVDIVYQTGRYASGVLRELRRVVMASQPQIVLSNSVKSHFLARMANLGRSSCWIAYHHGYTTTSGRTLVYNQLDRWSLRGAARVITVCHAFGQDLRNRGIPSERISILPVPVSPFAPASAEDQVALRNRLAIRDGVFVLLSVGRLSAEKGHADLIHALAVVRGMRPSLVFRCILVGNGPERERLTKLAHHLGVQDTVSFAGYQDSVAPYYSIADTFVLPSHSEGCPNVLLEAMAAGLPVIATSVGGVPEFVNDNEDALLVNARDPEALARSIVRVFESEPLRKRLAASATGIVGRHRPADYLRKLAGCFEQALSLEPATARRVARDL